MTAQHYTPGVRFGRLTILQRLPGTYDVKALCDCGTTTVTQARSLKYGTTQSCGCLHRERLAVRNYRHGKTKSRTYNIWSGLHTRCTNEHRREFPAYGGRGITVCKRWGKFENFLTDMGEAPDGFTLERREVNKGYSKANCIWATKFAQAQNRRDSVRLTWDGHTRSLSEWSEATGISRTALRGRIRLGWKVEQILTTPVWSRP